jgi:multidrug efflux pump subunit AcrA (membrane-fusion protein)
MSARKSQRETDEARLAEAAAHLARAQEDRDQALRETARTISRRRAGDLAGLTRSRVQQILNAPWTHRVRFVGYLDNDAEKALNGAGMEIRVSRGGGSVALGGELPPPNKHSIYLKANDPEEAKVRVERVLKGYGQFFSFRAEPVSPS